jgi:hypothetical protein
MFLVQRRAFLIGALFLAAAGIAITVYLVSDTSSAPETDSLFPDSIEHSPVDTPLTEPLEWGSFTLLPTGWQVHDYKVVFPQDVEARIAGKERVETEDTKLITKSALYTRYLADMPFAQQSPVSEAQGIAFGEEVTWLKAAFMVNGERVTVTLYPYVTGPIESSVPLDSHVETAIINGNKVVVDIDNPDLPKTPADIRALSGDLFLLVESSDLKAALSAAEQIL